MFKKVLFSAVLSFSTLVLAETKTYIREYSYHGNENDSRATARSMAITKVKKVLFEEICSQLKIADENITQAQIASVCLASINADVLEEKWSEDIFWIKANLTADPTEVVARIKELASGIVPKSKPVAEPLKKEQIKPVELKPDSTATPLKPDSTASQFYNLGVACKDKNDFINSIKYYNRCIKADSSFIPVYIDLAEVYLKIKDYNKAMDYFNETIKIDKDSTSLSRAYSGLGMMDFNIREYDKALEQFKKASQIDPKSPEPQNMMGLVYSKQKNYQLALACFEKSLVLQPNHTIALLNLGDTYKLMKDRPNAKVYYQKAVDISPDNADAGLKLGFCYYIEENLESALSCYQKVLDKHPTNAEAYLNMGRVYEDKKDFVKASIAYNKAIELNDKSATYFAAVGDFYRNQNDNQKSIKHYEQAVKLDPQFYGYQKTLGEIYFAESDYDKALLLFQESTKLSGNDPDIYVNLGKCYRLKKDYQKAVESFVKAVSINSKSKNAYIELCSIYFDLGKYTDIINILNNYQAISPNDIDILFLLSEANRKSGFYDQARTIANKILEVSSTSNLSYICLGNIDLDQKKLSQAADNYNKAFKIDANCYKTNTGLGLVEFENKNYDKSMIYFEKVATLKPNNAFAYYYLGEICDKKNDKIKAFGYYNMSVSCNPYSAEAQFKLAMSLKSTGDNSGYLDHLIMAAKLGHNDSMIILKSINQTW